ncbi:MAG: hypothetical protein AAGF24_00680 [Cyanobacteria bacterium P01_H01_bin.121]
MKLPKSTLFLILGALALGGGLYIYNSQVVTRQEQQLTTDQQLLDITEAEVEAIAIQLAGARLQFQRQPLETTETAVWQFLQPNQPPELANDATIAFLLNTLATGTSTDQFVVERDRLAEFGLDRPLSTTTITLADQTQYQVLLGDTDFSGEHRYAVIETLSPAPDTNASSTNASNTNAAPEAELQTQVVRVVPLQLEYATVRPPAEWRPPAEPAEAATDSTAPLAIPNPEAGAGSAVITEPDTTSDSDTPSAAE